MKRGSTLILKTVVILLGLIVLAICTLVLPRTISAELDGDFDYGFIMLGLYVTAIPFFIALYQTMKLLEHIDTDTVFSEISVKALKIIKYCALLISALFAMGMPYIFTIADRDDAPSVVLIGLVIIGTSFIIATSAAVLQKLLQNAIDIKAENDLTV